MRNEVDVSRRIATQVALVVGVLLASLVVVAAQAQAEPEPSAHHAEYPNLIGFRVGYQLTSEPIEDGREAVSSILLGPSVERVLIHEILELELAVPVSISLSGEERTVALPIDVHLKIPFHPASYASLYIALGPALNVQVRPDVRAFVGLSGAVGCYFWFSDRFGFDVEADYTVLSVDGRAAHEVLLASGPVFRL